jgi:hypothetical protein
MVQNQLVVYAGFFSDILLLMVESQAAESGGSLRLRILPAMDFWSNVTDRPLQRRKSLEQKP